MSEPAGNNEMIEQIKEALEKATPGPWKWIANGVCLFPERGQDYGDYVLFVQKSADLREEDAHLIANTPTYIRYLLDELENAQKENDELGDLYDTRGKTIERQLNELERLRTENTAMKEALEWYADGSNYNWGYPESNIMSDQGERALTVLFTLTKENPAE